MNKSAFICVILCGVLVACLPRLVAPSDSYISDSLNPVTTDNVFDLFPPFQTVYIDSNSSDFTVSLPLDNRPFTYKFAWSYSAGGSSFISTSSSSSIFYDLNNFIFIRPSSINSLTAYCSFLY